MIAAERTPAKIWLQDSRTGARRPVHLRLGARALEIRDPADGTMLALWSFGELAVVAGRPDANAGGKVAVCCAADPHTRLQLDDPALLEQLRGRAPVRPAGAGRRLPALRGLFLRLALPRRLRRPAAAGMAALALLLGGLAWHGMPAGNGRTDGPGRLCTAPAGQAALDQLAGRLAKAAASPGDVPGNVRLRVTDGHAAAILLEPGGGMVLSAGLLAQAATAEELAGLAAYGLARHPLGGDQEAANLAAAAGLLRRADLPVRPLDDFFLRLSRLRLPSDSPLAAAAAYAREGAARGTDSRPEALPPSPAPFHPALTAGQWQAVRAICR